MAKVQLDITSNLPQVLDQVAQANTEVTQTANEAGKAQKKAFDDTEKSAKREVVTIRSLTKEIRAWEAAALSAEEGTEEWANAIAKAGAKRAQLRDLKQAVDALDPDKMAQAYLNFGQSVAGVFTIAESGAALAGLRNEELQKSILRVQAAQGVLAGLQQLANSKDEIGKLRIIFLQKLQTLEIKKNIVAVEGATIAQRVWNLAMTGSGIAVLVAGITALVAAIALYQRETKIATEAEIERSKAIDGTIIKNEELRKSYNESVITLNELNNEHLVNLGLLTKTEAALDNLKLRYKNNRQEIENNTKAQIKEADSFGQLVLDQLQGFIQIGGARSRFNDRIAQIVQEGNTKLQEIDKKFEAERKLNEDQSKKDREDSLKKEFDDRAKAIDGQAKREESLVNLAFAKRQIDRISAEDKIADIQLKALQAQLANIVKYSKLGLDVEELALQKRTEIKNKEASVIQQNEQRTKDSLASIVSADEKAADDLIKTTEEKLKKIISAEGERAVSESKSLDRSIEKYNEYYEEKAVLDAEDLAREQAAAQARLDLYNQLSSGISASVQSIGDLLQIQTDNRVKQIQTETDSTLAQIQREIDARNNLGLTTDDLEKKRVKVKDDAQKKIDAINKKEFERQKKFAISTAIINGAQAVVNGLATQPFIPAGVAAGILAGVMTALEVAKIKSTTFRKGGYTGDFGVDQEVGAVHGKEFVHTAEKTKKHRKLFEAIHNDDYSKLRAVDLMPLLSGTGVSINKEKINEIPKGKKSITDQEAFRSETAMYEMRAMRNEFKKFSKYYRAYPDEKYLPDGSKVTKIGNVTRITRKR